MNNKVVIMLSIKKTEALCNFGVIPIPYVFSYMKRH